MLQHWYDYEVEFKPKPHNDVPSICSVCGEKRKVGLTALLIDQNSGDSVDQMFVGSCCTQENEEGEVVLNAQPKNEVKHSFRKKVRRIKRARR